MSMEKINKNFGYANHQRNIRHESGIELIYDPSVDGWLKFGCIKSAHRKRPGLRTHIWSIKEATEYLDQVVTNLNSVRILKGLRRD